MEHTVTLEINVNVSIGGICGDFNISVYSNRSTPNTLKMTSASLCITASHGTFLRYVVQVGDILVCSRAPTRIKNLHLYVIKSTPIQNEISENDTNSDIHTKLFLRASNFSTLSSLNTGKIADAAA